MSAGRPRILPPAVALLWLAVALVIHLATKPRPLAALSLRLGLAAAALAMGIALVAWPLRLFDRAGTTHKPGERPRALVSSGPYRWTRNPMYLGIALLMLGIGLPFGTWPFLVAPAGFLLTVDRAFVPGEERALETALGDEYRSYRSRVRRWL